MSVSPVNQSPVEWGIGRQHHLTIGRKIRSRALELALAVERLESALNACPHWEAPEPPHNRSKGLATYQCCSRVRDAQTACASAYEALAKEVADAEAHR